MQFNVMFARFPGLFSNGQAEQPDVTDWLVQTVIKAKSDPRIKSVMNFRKADTPIPMVRNECIERAQEKGADILVMVDSDMAPDLYLGRDRNARPFWDTTLEFVLDHAGPCVVAPPSCGPAPHENVYVFRWASHQSDHPNPDNRLEAYTREEAAGLTGIRRAAALPTGLIMIDMRAIEAIKPPYFYY